MLDHASTALSVEALESKDVPDLKIMYARTADTEWIILQKRCVYVEVVEVPNVKHLHALHG